MRRLIVENISSSMDRLSITGRDARYVNNVLRMKKGDNLLIMDGNGRSFEATILRVNYREVVMSIKNTLPPSPDSPLTISLAQALIKAYSMDYLFQKTTELGADSIRPFFSERTLLKTANGRFLNKMDHWREIVKSACRQCNRPKLPQIYPPVAFQELIENAPDQEGLKLLLWEDEDTQDLKHILRSTSPPPHVLAVVGPEGGFTVAEVESAKKAGFKTASIGNRILRAETAALSLLSIIQYEWGDLNLDPKPVTI